MLSCSGTRKFCACTGKVTENSSVSSDYTSSMSNMGDSSEVGKMSDEKSDCDKKLKKDRTSLFSIFSPRNIFKGFRKEMKTDNSMLKVERSK